MFAAKNNYLEALNMLVLVDNTCINEEDKNGMTILLHVLLAKTFKPKFASASSDAEPTLITSIKTAILCW